MSAVGDLGSAIKRLREAKGITQEQVVDRVPDLYSERSLRRIENGERKHPTRDRLLRLLTKGLLERDPATIDAILQRAGYYGTSNEEMQTYGLVRPEPHVSPAPPKPQQSPTHPLESREAYLAQVTRASQQSAFNLFTCSMYAALYVLSLLIEMAYDLRPSAIPVAIAVFAVIQVTSWIGLTVDHNFVRRGSRKVLWLALGTFVSGAVFQ